MMVPYLDLIVVALAAALLGQSLLFFFLLSRQKKSVLNGVRRLRSDFWERLRSQRDELIETFEQRQDRAAANVSELEQRVEQLEMRRSFRQESDDSGPAASRLDRKHQVFALARMGFDSRDISAKLRLSRAETELLMGLCGLNSNGEAKHARAAVR